MREHGLSFSPEVGTLNVPALRSSPLLDAVANGLMFNVSWFAIVLTQSAVMGPIIVALHLLLHFFLLGRGPAEWRLLGLVAVAGAVLDQLLFALGVFTVEGRAALAPLWLTCLWPVFATTLAHAFKGFQGRPLIAAVLGAVGGGGSYVAGARLSEVDFATPLAAPVAIAVLWAVLFPCLLWLAARWVPLEQNNER